MALPFGRWPCGSHSLRTACATSSGVMSRCWPAEPSIAVSVSAGVLPVFATTRATDSFVISVSTNPGQTALQVTLVPSSSAATLRVKPITACLAAEYAAMYRAPANPATDATFTTDPCLRITIAGMNACVQRNVPVAFTASTRFQSSSVILPSGALCAVPASVTSHCTAHALPPPPRISAATFSMRSAVRAATTIAAPSAARACAIAAPIPWPPPVTTATEPSNLCTDGLFENRAQRVDQACAFIRGGRRGITEIGARPSSCFEGALTRFDRLREGLGVGGQGLANFIADGIGLFAQDNRRFEPSGVTGAALEFISESHGPRFPCEVGEHDRQQPIGASELDGFIQRREVLRVEVRVGNRQHLKALLRQAAREMDHECRDGDAGNGQRAVKGGSIAGCGVGQRGQNQHL